MTALSRALMWGLLFCFPVGADAQQQQQQQHQQKPLELGIGVICNSADQVERYLALQVAKAPDAAIRLVNDEAPDSNACAVAAIAFVRGEPRGSVQAPGGMIHITPIVGPAAPKPAACAALPPILQFIAIFEKLEEA